MSKSKKISEWKQRSDIDYFPLFMSLWLAFDAWLQVQFSNDNLSQRQRLENLKENRHNDIYRAMKKILDDRKNLLPRSLDFKNNLNGLIIAMSRADIYYGKNEQEGRGNRTLSFHNSLIKRKGKRYQIKTNHFENLQLKNPKNTIKIANKVFLKNDIEKIFVAYIEIIYQARCKLLHGLLDPADKDNENFIKFAYLTFEQLMENI